ncbi:hypothetical protein TKK_0010089 [Trichogramma kaykai]
MKSSMIMRDEVRWPIKRSSSVTTSLELRAPKLRTDINLDCGAAFSPDGLRCPHKGPLPDFHSPTTPFNEHLSLTGVNIDR